MMKIEFDNISELRSDLAEMLAKSVKEWADKEVIPYRAQIDDDFEITERAMKKLFLDIGLQKLNVPEALGGAGISSEELPLVILRSFEEIGKADVGIGFVLSSVLASTASAQNSEVFDFLVERLSKDLCRVAIYPPQFGKSDFKGFELAKAVSIGDKVKIRGAGRPLNSGFDAEIYVVFCDYDGISLAFIEAEEVERSELIKTTGLIASRNCDVRIKAEIEKKKILAGDAWRKLYIYLNFCLSALCVGSALDSCRILGDWAEKRTIRGKPLRDNTVDAIVIADVVREAIEAKSIAQILAKMMLEDRNEEEVYTFSVLSALKCSSSAFISADRAMELMASQGYAREGLLEKQWRDAKSIKTILNPYHLLLELSANYFGAKIW
ncbi:MAG: acyl-CoA/acyl-ACP dehydrogenase [Archaeoglobaceae archaeon]|nr:acyl-CoA/acyl-ACP dehydrogenase [Archaeoglobaceae archaeon]MDW8118169.1 acyl-CoA dehydrogenase family protein [Archaeoglobaceae archaeon]